MYRPTLTPSGITDTEYRGSLLAGSSRPVRQDRFFREEERWSVQRDPELQPVFTSITGGSCCNAPAMISLFSDFSGIAREIHYACERSLLPRAKDSFFYISSRIIIARPSARGGSRAKSSLRNS